MSVSRNSTPLRFGRAPRSFNPRVPHLSALASGLTLPPIPDSVDYTKDMPDDLGMMLNDNLGDCTCAAYYHARQIWSFDARSREITEPDSDVEDLYVEACGYDPTVPGPGPGGNEQAVLTYLLKYGAPLGSDGTTRDKILAFVEVDSRNIEDMKRTIYDCGVAYIGFPVPENVSSNAQTWDYDPKAPMTNEGHAVVLAGYDAKGATVISWGKRYTMTWPFVVNIVDEAYAIADKSWLESCGKTPAGMTLTQLEAQMHALKTSDLGTPFAFASRRTADRAKHDQRPRTDADRHRKPSDVHTASA
jgi:hypothetical protein